MGSLARIAIAGLFGFSVIEAAAQTGRPFASRDAPVVADHSRSRYPDRVPLQSVDDDEVVIVIDRRGRRYFRLGGYPGRPDGYRYVRVLPGAYEDYGPPQRYVGRFGRHGRERHAALQRPDVPVRHAPAFPDSEEARLAPRSLDARPYGAEAPLPAHLRRQIVPYQTKEPPGTIVVDTRNTYLYLVLEGGHAIRYGIGVGREGFTWSGRERITRMAEWPDWIPPPQMIARQPYLPRFMAGGPGNPLGARALYLGNTLYRIHGTNEPLTIGQFVSSGCIRMTNEDVTDLYERVQVGTRIVVLPGGRPPATAAAVR